MEKVRPRCGQPSDRRRLKTKQNSRRASRSHNQSGKSKKIVRDREGGNITQFSASQSWIKCVS